MNGPAQPMSLDTLHEPPWSIARHRVLTVASDTGLAAQDGRGTQHGISPLATFCAAQ